MSRKAKINEKVNLIRQRVDKEKKIKDRSRGEELLRKLLVSDVGEIRWDELGVAAEAARNVNKNGQEIIRIRANSTSDADDDAIASELRISISKENFYSAEICADMVFGSWTDWIPMNHEEFFDLLKKNIVHDYARSIILKTSMSIHYFQFIEDYIVVIVLRQDISV